MRTQYIPRFGGVLQELWRLWSVFWLWRISGGYLETVWLWRIKWGVTHRRWWGFVL